MQAIHSDASVVMFTDRGRQCTTLPSIVGLIEGGTDLFLPAELHLCASTALRRVTALLIKQRACEYDATDSVGVQFNFSC